MKKNTTIKLIALFNSLACSAEIACGGLFLLNDYSLTLGEHKFSASVGYSRYHLNYGDDWELDIGSYGFPGDDGSGSMVGSFAYQSDYKFLTLGASVDTRPWVNANMVLHTADSTFYLGSELGRGDQSIARVKWSYADYSDIVPEISADWETHILNKGLSAGFKAHGHKLDLAGNYYKSTPFNRDEDYFIRDSLDIWDLRASYSWSTAGREKNRADKFRAGYRFINANATLYGIRAQDGDTKRFMYAPLSGTFHIADVEWNDITGSEDNGSENPNILDLDAMAIFGQAHLKKDGTRFHETLAPNRALRTSVMQALSFSFLQKNYRVDAEAEGFLGLAGLSYHKAFGSNQKRFVIEPKIGADFYYLNGSLDTELTSETTKFISTIKEKDYYTWDVYSIGSIVNLGLRFAYGPFYLNANAYQLVPFTTEVDDHKDLPVEPIDPNLPAKKEEPYAFGNGLFCTLNVGFSF